MNSKERIIFWVVVFITVVFNLLGLIYFLSFYGGTNGFLLFIIAKFKDNYDWILPSLTLISSLIILCGANLKSIKETKKLQSLKFGLNFHLKMQMLVFGKKLKL
ncbi:hypothetical protein [Marinitoga lauensis]|uniref:hypothetical protein n=1 Tax=Marinitoga lauensis TaxID=2201189 RepID=UPI001404C8DF|nr:hypothetical protein [Marinitoga lauensis]